MPPNGVPSEVSSAVTASTLTTVCVFMPITFVEGIAGQLFGDMALTVTFSLLASLLTALYLIPAGSVAKADCRRTGGGDHVFWAVRAYRATPQRKGGGVPVAVLRAWCPGVDGLRVGLRAPVNAGEAWWSRLRAMPGAWPKGARGRRLPGSYCGTVLVLPVLAPLILRRHAGLCQLIAGTPGGVDRDDPGFCSSSAPSGGARHATWPIRTVMRVILWLPLHVSFDLVLQCTTRACLRRGPGATHCRFSPVVLIAGAACLAVHSRGIHDPRTRQRANPAR